MHGDSEGLLRFRGLAAGQRYELGEIVMRREEIVHFAAAYDPQPIHLDDEAARANPLFKGLSASGWHSTLLLQLRISAFWKASALRGLAGAGVHDLRWHHPIYPGDRFDAHMVLESVRVSRTKPDRAIIAMNAALCDAKGRPATSMILTGIFAVD